MSGFDLAIRDQQNKLSDFEPTGPEQAGFFEGSGTGFATGLGKFGTDAALTFNLGLSSVAGSFDAITGNKYGAQEWAFRHWVDPLVEQRQRMTPDPLSVGTAGQILHGLTKLGTEAALLGAPGVLTLETIGGTMDQVQAGVDAKTAQQVGVVQGLTLTAGVMIPMTLGARSLTLQNVLYGSGVNISQGVFQRAATSEILESAGYKELAEQYKALDTEAVAIDAVLGGAFAGLGHVINKRGAPGKKEPAPATQPGQAEIDAALVANQALHLETAGPGIPADMASRAAHVDNLTGAIDALIEGRPVDLRREVGEFVPNKPADDARAELRRELQAIREAETARIEQEAQAFGQAMKAADEAKLQQEMAAMRDSLGSRPEIAAAEYRDALDFMAKQAGWAQRGGQVLRDAEGNVTGRTEWIPAAEWWPGRTDRMNEARVADAVNKALAGEPLKAAEQRTIDYMLTWADENIVRPMRQMAEAERAAIADDLARSDMDANPLNVVEADMVARASRYDEAAVERAAMMHPEDDRAFIRAIKEILDANQDKQAAGSRQADRGQATPDATGPQPGAFRQTAQAGEAARAEPRPEPVAPEITPEQAGEIATRLATEQDADVQGAIQAATENPEIAIILDDEAGTQISARDAMALMADAMTVARQMQTGIDAAVKCFLRP